MRQVDELWVGEIPPHSLGSVEETLADFGVPFRITRAESQAFFQLSASPQLDSLRRAELVSKLSRFGFPFEFVHLGQDGERYCYLPKLGIHRVSLNEIGEEQLGFGHLEEMLKQSAGSNREFRALLLRAVGEPWTTAIQLIREGEKLRVA